MTATIKEDSAGITKELATGKFTDEMLADMRALIGTELRTDACVNNEYATRLAILRFCEGIGDDNPLWTDADYAAKTPHGDADRAAELHLRLPGLGAGRLARPRRLPCRDQDDLPPADPRGRQDHRPGVLRRLRRPDRRQQLRRPPHQGLPAPGVPEPGRRAGGHVHLLAHALRARRDAEARGESRKIELPHPWTDEELAAIEEEDPGRDAARRRPRATGRTCRSATRSTSSPRGRSG